jgi:hypothetical protein
VSETPESKPLSVAETTAKPTSGVRPDWFFRGALARIGDSLDRMTGRKLNPSSIATSELIRRLIAVLESEKRQDGAKGFVVPHNIRLKLQWNKFSDEEDENIEKLRDELVIAAVDHINDNLYHTVAPLNLEVKKDYFVEGVKILVSFEDLSAVDLSAAEANVTLAGGISIPDSIISAETPAKRFTIRFEFEVNNVQMAREFASESGDRFKIGRHASNDIMIKDASVSKFHSSLVVGKVGEILIADTGSTNGTTVDGVRIDYGKTLSLTQYGKIGVGDISIKVTITDNSTVDSPKQVMPDIDDVNAENSDATNSDN